MTLAAVPDPPISVTVLPTNKFAPYLLGSATALAAIAIVLILVVLTCTCALVPSPPTNVSIFVAWYPTPRLAAVIVTICAVALPVAVLPAMLGAANVKVGIDVKALPLALSVMLLTAA